jgi:hypothetical protein
MRKPFLFFLLLISLWIWSLDFTDILFYYLKYHYGNFAGYGTAFIVFGILAFYFTKLFLKYFGITSLKLSLTKEQLSEFSFLILCFLPILFLNYQRIMFPDINYDLRAYHIFLQRINRLENLQNFNLVGGGGGGTYFFTLSYKVFGFSRELLGFRLGTLFNTYLLFLCYASLYDFLKMFISSVFPGAKIHALLLSLSAFFIIFSDNTLFVLNSYMADLIGIPLLLELLHLLFFKPLNNKNRTVVSLFFFLLTSIVIAYKLTYLPYLGVIGLFFLIRNRNIFLENKELLLLGFIVIFFPSVYLFYNYTETLNPIFPFYNKFFQSPLYESINFKDTRWGPRNFLELFYYNIICLFHKERNNEWQFFSLRLLAEYLIILTSLSVCIYHRFKLSNSKISFIVNLSIIAVLCNYLLLYTTGYYRYGILIEMLFGLTIILWLSYLFIHKKWVAAGAIICLMSIQGLSTFNRYFRHGLNMSWYDYKALRSTDNGMFLKDQSRLLFNDYNTGVDTILTRLNINGFLSSDCNGYIKLLAPQIPIYNTSSFGKRQLVADDFERTRIDTLSQKHNFYFLTTLEDMPQKIGQLNKRNYFIDTIVDVYPTFTVKNMPLYLFKIRHFQNKEIEIINKTAFLRVDSAGFSPHYFYRSTNKFKSYIIEDPYTYNWPERPDSAKFTVNQQLHQSYTRGDKNKIVVIPEGNELSFTNYKKLHYLIITQEIQPVDKSGNQ